jgi:hypothetical protein
MDNKSAYTQEYGAITNANVVPSAPVAFATPVDSVYNFPCDDMVHVSNSQSKLTGANNKRNLMLLLRQKRTPEGLITFFMNELEKSPKRYFVCDDSGSMTTTDGKIINELTNSIVKCTRWFEMITTIDYLVELSNSGEIDSTFMYLNAGTYGKNRQHIDISNLPTSPGGKTPLCEVLTNIINEIRPIAPEYKRQGKTIMIVILTDGEASDGNIREPLAALHDMPVHITIRLCTDQQQIVNYWNDIDSDLEINLDIIDDYIGEATEINNVNPWLTYGLQLHRLREFGLSAKEIDLIDERRMVETEIINLASIIYGSNNVNLLDSDIKSTVAELNNDSNRTLNPVNMTQEHWIKPAQFPKNIIPQSNIMSGNGNSCSNASKKKHKQCTIM